MLKLKNYSYIDKKKNNNIDLKRKGCNQIDVFCEIKSFSNMCQLGVK